MTLTARHTLLLDAAATAATAVLMFATRGLLYPYFGLSSPLLLDVTAAAFLIYAAIIAVVARQPIISRTSMLIVAGANIGYVVASMVMAVMWWGQMHAVGRALIVAVALAVEAFATLQYLAARRSPAHLPAMSR